MVEMFGTIIGRYMKLISDLDVSGKKVFLRADLDVDVSAITDPTQIVRLNNLKPTVDYLLEHGAKQIVIAGHIGRPTELPLVHNPQVPFFVPNLSTKNLVAPLEKILGQKIVFCEDFGHITDAQILLFENLRFWRGETLNDPVFTNRLAILGQVYVNDAFGNCHREHASMVRLPQMLMHAAGLHLEEEVNQITKLINNPQRPFVAIVGGYKKETKLPVIANLAKLADKVLVGGALVIELAGGAGPLDALPNVIIGTLTLDKEDLDEATINNFKEVVAGAKTVVWNGPLGHFETGHANGSMAIAQAVAGDAFSVVGGGETTEFLAKNNLLQKFSFVSSGGGAMLELLAGKKLPGIEALE